MIKCKSCKSIFNPKYAVNIPMNSTYSPLIDYPSLDFSCPICKATLENFDLKRTSKGSELDDDCSNYDKYAHTDKPDNTVDMIIAKLNRKTNEVTILTIERKVNPYKGYYALPGGYVDMTDDNIRDAVSRELFEETNVENIKFKQLSTRGTSKRDPRNYTVSTCYYAVIDNDIKTKAGDDARSCKWFDIKDTYKLAFDHSNFVGDLINEFKYLYPELYVKYSYIIEDKLAYTLP